MLYKISDLIVEIPATGDMPERCSEYIISDKEISADIIIRADLYELDRWPTLDETASIYMETGLLFYRNLLHFEGMMLHASAVEYKGKAYLFSADSRVGKSTHTKLWKQLYGDDVQIFNDDKPALRRIDGKWYAYGTPWCGKNGINQNKKVPLGGICFIKRGAENKIVRMFAKDAVVNIIRQSTRKLTSVDRMDLLLGLVDQLVREIPIFELECLPDEDAAGLSSTTMCRTAQEENL